MPAPTTEANNPASAAIDSLDARGIVRVMVGEDAAVPGAVAAESEAIARAIEVIADRLRAGGRLVYMGAGTSGRLGVLDASECPPTFSTPPGLVVGLIAGGPDALTRAIEGAEDRPELGVADLERIGIAAADVVVGIATSGRTPYVLGGLDRARQAGAFTIAVACSPASAVAAAADLAIVPLVGPEVIAGSTRLKAGTATKLVLNMLSTGAMIRLGKTYGNLMVDLRATNSKLLDRSQRIAARLTGLDEPSAAELLARHDGELKTAIVAARRGVSGADARRLLAAAAGQLRGALEEGVPPPPVATDLVIGVDGGGSGCRAVIARRAEGEPVPCGRGRAGAANPRAVGVPAAAAAIRAALAEAFTAAAVEPRRVAVACLGLAGAGRETDASAMGAALADVADEVIVTTDAELVLGDGVAGATVALVAGTGSIAVMRRVDGGLERAGGWGAVMGDEGSGAWIAGSALAAVAAAADGRGAETALTPRLLERYGVRRPQDLVTLVQRPESSRAEFARLAEEVEAAAIAGDAVARSIVDAAAGHLAALVTALARRRPRPADPWDVHLGGGLLVHATSVAAAVEDRVRRGPCPPARVVVVADAAIAATRIAARRAAGRR